MGSYKTSNKSSRKVNPIFSQSHTKGIAIPDGVYIGIVIDNEDVNDMGRVKVSIPRFFGVVAISGEDKDRYNAGIWCRIMTPIGGTSQVDEDGNIMSYGIWGQAPAIGTEVAVAFGGDSDKGVVIGVLAAESKNSTMAGPIGQDSDQGVFEPTYATSHTSSASDKPPAHPQADALKTQGLDKDALRGPSYSNPRRESPSKVFGLSTPDGHSMVMDDGDENGDSDLIRIRTAGGAQIIMDDTNGFTYFINKSGSTWIEMNSNGDLDVYAQNSLNLHTEGDLNMYSGANINIEAKNDIFMTANGSTGMNFNVPAGEFQMKCAKDFKLTTDLNGNVLAAGNYTETAALINMNGPPAAPAIPKPPAGIPGNSTVTSGIVSRAPEREPWKGHVDKKDV